MIKLNSADLMVIVDTLHRSLNVAGYSKWTKETREHIMEKVIVIMEEMTAEVVSHEMKSSPNAKE